MHKPPFVCKVFVPNLILYLKMTHLRSSLFSFIFSTKKGSQILGILICLNRGDGIRTHDLYVPNVALYQTEPRPDQMTTKILSNLTVYVNHQSYHHRIIPDHPGQMNQISFLVGSRSPIAVPVRAAGIPGIT